MAQQASGMMTRHGHRIGWAFLAASVAFAVGLAGCDQAGGAGGAGGSGGAASQATPASQTETEAPIVQQAAIPDGPPKIQFDRTRHDFGRMLETETRATTIRFTNVGGETLRISGVTATCGCTVPSLDKFVYGPGESGEIDVTFDPTGPNEPGQPQIKYVRVASNASEEPLQVSIVADVQPFIMIEPRMLQFGVLEFRKGHREYMTISSLDEDFELISVQADNPSITTRILPDDPSMISPGAEEVALGKQVEVVVSPDAPWGGLYCAMHITVRGRTAPNTPPITHTASIRVAGQVFGKVHAKMVTAEQKLDTFRFGIDPGQQFERRVELYRPDGQPFRIVETSIIESELDSASVRPQQLSPDAWDVVLVGTGEGRAQQYRGIVRVITDVPGEETIDIPIFGVIRKGPATG